MSKKLSLREMSQFLSSIGGLDIGLDEGKIVDPRYFEHGPGWYALEKELIQDLIKLGWDRRIVQVKEKFGGLRFYIGEGSDEIFDRIDRAEEESIKICERCGNPGRVVGKSWLRCLCDECNK
jgi:hypothetical protein